MAAKTPFLEIADEFTKHNLATSTMSPAIHEAQFEAPYSHSAATDLPMLSYVLKDSARQTLWPSSADGSAEQYGDIRRTASKDSGAATAELIDETLKEDPSYRPPTGIHEQIMHNSTDLSLNYSRTTNHELAERTPFIPLPGRDLSIPTESPLYHYGHGLEGLHHGELPPVSEAPAQDKVDLWGMHNPPRPGHVLQGTRVANYEVLVSPGHKAARAIQTSERRNEGLNAPANTVGEAANTLSLVYPLHIQRNDTPCFECCFARVSKLKCEGIPGKPCTRCTKLAFQLRKSLKGSKEVPNFITRILLFDLKAIQRVLSNLRAEAHTVLDLNPNIILEDFFAKNPMICHMASPDELDASLARESLRVVIKGLSTTQKAASEAAFSNLNFPSPGLNASQMDSFIKVANRMCRLESLTPIEKDIISAALKISDYMGILFNWDANMIRFDKTTRNYEGQDPENASLVLAKNIVLETVYSSFLRPLDLSHDPATISCALWIMYTSFNCFQKLTWRDTHLEHLKVFLNGMRGRAESAITAIERYRKEFAFARCGRSSPNQNAFRELIVAKKVPKSAIAFAYERVVDHPFLQSMPDYSSQQCYTEVLEARILETQFLTARYFSEKKPETSEMKSTGSRLTLAVLDQRDGETWPKADFDNDSTTSQFSFLDAEESNIPDHLLSSVHLPTRSIESPSDIDLDLLIEIRQTKERLKALEDMRHTPQHKPVPAPDNPHSHEDWIAPEKSLPSASLPGFGTEVDAMDEMNLAVRRYEAQTAGGVKRSRSCGSDEMDGMSRALKARTSMMDSVQQLPAAVEDWNEVCRVPSDDLVKFWLAEMELTPFLKDQEDILDRNGNFHR